MESRVLNDLHIPYHDPRSVALVLNIFKDAKVNEIVINGDLLDFYAVNSHGPKHPDIQETLESELIAGREFLEGIRKMFPDEKIMFLYGNHEHRLERFILDKCPAFWNIVKLEAQLNLERLNIEWKPYNSKYMLNSRIGVQHSPPSYGENGARTSLMKKPSISMIYGCTHRVQHSCITGGDGIVNHVWFNGCLIKMGHKVFDYAKGHENWQEAFSLVDVKGDEFHVHQIHINKYKASWGDNHYEF